MTERLRSDISDHLENRPVTAYHTEEEKARSLVTAWYNDLKTFEHWERREQWATTR
jgi:hypothetical protein